MDNLIRVERAKKRMTQADLANALNVSRQTIHSIETGKFVPSTVLALRIAKYFGVEFNDIFAMSLVNMEPLLLIIMKIGSYFNMGLIPFLVLTSFVVSYKVFFASLYLLLQVSQIGIKLLQLIEIKG